MSSAPAYHYAVRSNAAVTVGSPSAEKLAVGDHAVLVVTVDARHVPEPTVVHDDVSGSCDKSCTSESASPKRKMTAPGPCDSG